MIETETEKDAKIDVKNKILYELTCLKGFISELINDLNDEDERIQKMSVVIGIDILNHFNNASKIILETLERNKNGH